MVEKKEITIKTAESMIRDMVIKPIDPEKLMGKKKMTRIFDKKALESVVKQVIDENTNTVLDYKSGKSEAFHFLVGQAMKKTEGRGDPETIRKLLKKMLS
jgi:aspartyl-tRNA(Asn)/glutamyl-tRNA(Gln) amidotransferase subunit B